MIELSRYVFEALRNDEESVLYRGRREENSSQAASASYGAPLILGEAKVSQERRRSGSRSRVLVLAPAKEKPGPESLKRLEHEFSLKEELDPAWAARPVAKTVHWDRPVLVLEDPGGRPLDQLLTQPLDLGSSLRLATSLATAIGHLHRRGMIHKNVKPANVLADSATGQVWLMGFGIASQLPRERQFPEPPEFIAGTLAYMAPEQTGRMNRSIDSRSDLYAFGVTLYEMLTGVLPFTAADPMEWVHCHVARQPTPPDERAKGIPRTVSTIVMRLLAKTAEDRYQTAAGVEADLRRCLAEWEKVGGIDSFSLGTHDASDRLWIPERLYGRDREVKVLLDAFERVVVGGSSGLALVSGYSGIGKSSVVNELQKAIVLPRGLFIAGKFDQHKRDIPYSTFAQAFQSLIGQILGKSKEEVDHWREIIRQAVGPNGRLITNLIPELDLIIGQQSPVPPLPPQETQHRFQAVFRRFLGVFARKEHPLTVFLDDLQWLDAATLTLIEHLVSHPDVKHLLIIGAYRDNELSTSHPFMLTLDSIRKAGVVVDEIVLKPLSLKDVNQFIADALRCERVRSKPLAQLVHKKTAGNPFFVIQFLTALAEEHLVEFDARGPAWSWDLARIRAKGYTDNVVDLMAGKLSRLPATTQEALGQLACLGNVAEIATIALVQRTSEKQIHADLWEAVRAGLVFRLDSAYTFLHDRVQEAAYALIPESERSAVHLRIGRLFASRTASEETEEKIFEIVNQLNRGIALIDSPEERVRVAELNLVAGKRAKSSTAYASALTYFVAGRALLAQESWEQHYPLTFVLEFQRAECEFLTGDFAAAEERLSMLSRRAGNLVDSAAVTRLQTELYATLDKGERAVEVALEYLRRVGIDWSPHPTKEELRQEYERIWQQLGDRPIEALVDLPAMTDPTCRATLDVLTAVEEPAYFTDENLQCLVIARMANFSLEHGNSDGSCVAYVQLGWLVGSRFADYQAGFRFGKLGLDLMEKRGLERFRAQVSQCFGYFVNPWSRHLRTGLGLLRRSFTTAQEAGDVKYAVFSCDRLVNLLLAAGDPLDVVQREAENGLEFARKANFGYVVDIIIGQLRLIRTLRGLTPNLSSFNDSEFDESRFERHLEADPHLVFATCWYWIRKLQARFYAGDYASALGAAAKAAPLLQTPGHFESAEYLFYDALARAAQCDAASSEQRTRHREVLATHHQQIVVLAKNCPENFGDRATLVAAEIARIDGRDLDAMHLYEEAIHLARENGFIQNEAVAHEVAARFYAARGFETFAQTYFRNARYCYLRWGALGKVRQIDQRHPPLHQEGTPSSVATIETPVEQLDLGTVMKASQAVSGEIVLEHLVETLMVIAVEHAGAERGLLILPHGEEHRIAAEARTGNDEVEVRLRQTSVTPSDLPASLLRYVIRTQESVILDDASVQNLFLEDEYIRQQRPRSILCLPLMKQAKLMGALYLENNLAPQVFTTKRLSMLKLLASQAAISLDHARLVAELTQENSDRRKAEEALRASEERWRELAENSSAGIALIARDGHFIAANLALQKMLGYSEDELQGRTVSNISHEEDRAASDALIAEAGGGQRRVYRVEKRYLRKDGRVMWADASTVFVPASGSTAAFFSMVIVDITERKRAEEELHRKEASLREAQTELAHVSRVTTMGEMAASIAHEVNQPLAGIVTNANATLRWLAGDPPNLEEAHEAIRRIARDGKRAGDVVSRMWAIFKKAGTTKERLDINGAIEEVVILAQSEVQRNRVSLRIQLAKDLPLILGDRIQLQQVILNLLVNAIEAMSEADEGPRELWVSSQKAIGIRAESERDTIAEKALTDSEWSQVLIAVRDSGPGLDPKRLDRLFDAFYTTKPQGLGMGLAISRSIVEAHGGRLWAKANTPRGALFQFTLPVRDQRIS
ncbi:MAG TPA: AAA family ATPase [Chthoniobacterales bacterium]|nr:AAA family ATPase [Chthoniobacterales bacterium]